MISHFLGYTVIWFWFYFLAFASILNLIYRFFTIVCPSLRVAILKSNCKANKRDIHCVLKNNGIGDWFLLCLLAKNMDKKNFGELLIDLKVKIQAKEKIM